MERRTNTTHGARAEEEFLRGLTDAQRSAVLATEGPVLVLAAAGSGKTRVITRRIAHLISCGIPAWSILALTFTNKAAGEMRERVGQLLCGGGEGGSSAGVGDDRRTRGLTISTFHALCARLLRRHAESAGLKPDFTIYDTSDQSALCKRVIASMQLSSSNFPPRSVLSAISQAKNELLDAEAFAARAHDFSSRSVAKIYSAYSRALRAANAVDFDDLLLLTARMLGCDAGVRSALRERWQYLMIDEYQDTNKAQFEIASRLVGEAAEGEAGGGVGRPNIFVVGDPDQAIYGWRGADISNILDFEEHYPSARVITLGENFRSTTAILAAADTLIGHNKRRKPKPLFTSRVGGEKVEAVLCAEERQEAALVVDWMRRIHEESEGEVAWREMAVFYRTNALSRVLEEAFRGANVPYTIARGTAFYEREEIKNALAYLRVVANPADDISLERIVNTPSRGIGDAAWGHVGVQAAAKGVPMLGAMREWREMSGMSSRAGAGVAKFVEMIDSWTGGGTFLGSEVPSTLAELVDRVVRESGLQAMYRAQASASQNESDAERLDNLDELVSSAREFEQEFDPSGDPEFFGVGGGELASESPSLLAMLRAYLESIALVADADAVDPSQGSVTLMTLHAAKGLEFQAVAMVGLEEGALPHARAFERESELEEERRLCFVGITRAMRRLLMTSSKYRTIRGIPERTMVSRFLGELPKEHVVFSDRAGDSSWGESGGGSRDEARGGADAEGPRFVPDEADTPRGGARGGPRAGGLRVGDQVRHPQFGVGKVMALEGGVNARAKIAFRDVGMKTMVLEYARLTRV